MGVSSLELPGVTWSRDAARTKSPMEERASPGQEVLARHGGTDGNGLNPNFFYHFIRLICSRCITSIQI